MLESTSWDSASWDGKEDAGLQTEKCYELGGLIIITDFSKNWCLTCYPIILQVFSSVNIKDSKSMRDMTTLTARDSAGVSILPSIFWDVSLYTIHRF